MNIIKKVLLNLIFVIIINAFAYPQSNYNILYIEGKNDQILKQSLNKVEINNANIDDFYWLAYTLHANGKQTESIKHLQEGVKQYQKSERLKKLLADYYFELGDLFNAQLLYQHYKKDIQYALKLSNIYEANTNYTEAINLLNPFILKDSLNLSCLKHLAYNYFKLGDFINAELYYTKILSISPYDQESAKTLIGIYNNKGKYSLERENNLDTEFCII